MDSKLTPAEKELYQRVDEVLHYIWDPLAVADVPAARDEYQSYVPKVFQLLQRNAPAKEIADYLVSTALETIGLSGHAEHQKRAGEVVEILENWRDEIAKRAPRV